MNVSQDQRTHSRAAADHPLPASLSDVALIDVQACAAAGGMSVSWWRDEVCQGRAPAPAVRKPRCTRWLLSDVRAFWIEFAKRGTTDTEAGDAMRAHLSAARAKAKAKHTGSISKGSAKAPGKAVRHAALASTKA